MKKFKMLCAYFSRLSIPGFPDPGIKSYLMVPYKVAVASFDV